jgi:DNA-directed RNA polymerase subunit F
VTKNIINSKALSLPEAYKVMVKRSEQEPMLTEIQSKTLDYLKEFGGDRDIDRVKQSIDKLLGLGLNPEVSIVLVDICPTTVDEVFSILQMDKEFELTPEIARDILNITKESC